MEQKNKGGKRKGAGRKPTTNPKEIITLYIERSKLWKFGGLEPMKEKIYDFVEKYEGAKIKFAPIDKDSYDGKKINSREIQDEVGQSQHPLTPEELVTSLENRLRRCKDAEQIKSTVLAIEKSDLGFFAKRNLKQLAEEVGKDFYTD